MFRNCNSNHTNEIFADDVRKARTIRRPEDLKTCLATQMNKLLSIPFFVLTGFQKMAVRMLVNPSLPGPVLHIRESLAEVYLCFCDELIQ